MEGISRGISNRAQLLEAFPTQNAEGSTAAHLPLLYSVW